MSIVAVLHNIHNKWRWEKTLCHIATVWKPQDSPESHASRLDLNTTGHVGGDQQVPGWGLHTLAAADVAGGGGGAVEPQQLQDVRHPHHQWPRSQHIGPEFNMLQTDRDQTVAEERIITDQWRQSR